MRNLQATILSGASSGSVTGSAIDVGQTMSASFQVVTAAVDAAGTVKIQISNDNPGANGLAVQGSFVPTNWSDLTSATITVASGAGAPLVLPNMCFRWIRAIYTRSGGGSAAVITIEMNSLGV